jgi:hypothetical protein
MKTTTTFHVYDMTSSHRSYLGERATFDEAEAFGRWHAARRGIRVTIDEVTQTTKRRETEEAATVVRDALGRLWTDLTWHGATFV